MTSRVEHIRQWYMQNGWWIGIVERLLIVAAVIKFLFL